MYDFKLTSKPDVPWLIPTLTRELSLQETAPPIQNKK
jgi:branched-chain amino acid transport system substrate-binding protein